MHKFGTWLNEWMLSGKKGLSKQTFTSCFQTSQSFPLLIQHLLEIKGFDYILTGNNQSDPPEKRFGRYRQLSDANYSGSEKQFLDAEKSMNQVSHQISGYTMKEVGNIMGNDSVEAQAEVEHCGNVIIEMLLPPPDLVHMAQMDADIVYYIAGFISKKVKKAVTCVACGDILGENSILEIIVEGMIPENHQSFFMDEINTGGLVKLSDPVHAICVLAWDTYLQIMENS